MGFIDGREGCGKARGMRRMLEGKNINTLIVRLRFKRNQSVLFRSSLCTTTHWAPAPEAENLKGLMKGIKELGAHVTLRECCIIIDDNEKPLKAYSQVTRM